MCLFLIVQLLHSFRSFFLVWFWSIRKWTGSATLTENTTDWQEGWHIIDLEAELTDRDSSTKPQSSSSYLAHRQQPRLHFNSKEYAELWRFSDNLLADFFLNITINEIDRLSSFCSHKKIVTKVFVAFSIKKKSSKNLQRLVYTRSNYNICRLGLFINTFILDLLSNSNCNKNVLKRFW